ncbi:MAG: sulfide/dihydroorotate dehydrogenase-like FAD/NAD-binding protein [Candidatus Omnitrophica bacterium]|nr:sulfide/dihydroorotate dehydrogenase-like FAD/NAD-binding protein [Candidatus Omnitrophota bacterium]
MMEIINKKILAEALDVKITQLEVLSPDISKKTKPGQFVVVMVNEHGERIPLTIAYNDNKGITLIFQEVGLTTKLLGKLNIGDSLYALTGPLGRPTEIKKYGRVILAGGGVGIAEIFPVAKALKEAGNHITTILGARTKKLLILENELKEISNEVYVVTDDGSYGKKGFTTDILQNLLTNNSDLQTINLIYTVGPIPMMKKIASLTKPFNIKTIVSLNALMVDGTGMCGGCRVSIGGETKFSCIDGPEFNGHLVDWDELEKRNKIYLNKEKHICNLYNLS